MIFINCSLEKAAQISQGDSNITGVISLARFPACGAIVMSVEREAEVMTLCRSGLVFICLVGGQFETQ